MKKSFKHESIYLIFLSIGIIMLGLSYGSVPLYKLYCQIGGLGGLENTGVEESLKNKPLIDSKGRSLTVHFKSDVSQNMEWEFKPLTQKIQVFPGETALTFYLAENKTSESISGVSTYNILPQKTGVYFNKIQCFCFEEQRLKPNESIEMPILFYIDSEFLDDPKMKDVDSITLNYTFYKMD